MPSTAGQNLSRHSGHVVAGLIDNVMATAVAAVAVDEATRRHASITFLHVVPEGLSTAAHADVAASMFQTVLRATGADPDGVTYTFETVSGDAAETLVESCADAEMLVVGADDADATVRVAQYCKEHSACAVRVVGASPAAHGRGAQVSSPPA